MNIALTHPKQPSQKLYAMICVLYLVECTELNYGSQTNAEIFINNLFVLQIPKMNNYNLVSGHNLTNFWLNKIIIT